MPTTTPRTTHHTPDRLRGRGTRHRFAPQTSRHVPEDTVATTECYTTHTIHNTTPHNTTHQTTDRTYGTTITKNITNTNTTTMTMTDPDHNQHNHQPNQTHAFHSTSRPPTPRHGYFMVVVLVLVMFLVMVVPYVLSVVWCVVLCGVVLCMVCVV